MSEWTHPDDLTQEDLHRFRTAAEAAWSDDTRHEHYRGHPNPSAGQCYVTSRWLIEHLGGQVGVKQGHYFWVSPDRTHVVDLTGDQFSYSPEDMTHAGMRLDSEDEGWYPTEDQKRWRPGPIMYKRADHPLFDGFRVKSFKTKNKRLQTFIDRANRALSE